MLVAVLQQEIEQPRLRLFDQLGHGDGGVNVRHCVVSLRVLDAVGAREMLQAEAGEAVFVFRPDDAVRAQGVAGAHHIQQIPARVAVLPAVGIGIVEVAIEDIAAHFVIETDVVVTENAGAGHAESLVDLAGEFGFVNAFGARYLRRDAGDHHRPGSGR